jgi:XRN 5'-3' exonuclease N-terminus
MLCRKRRCIERKAQASAGSAAANYYGLIVYDCCCCMTSTIVIDRNNRINTDKAWRKIKVILSDASQPGEGEHKVTYHSLLLIHLYILSNTC